MCRDVWNSKHLGETSIDAHSLLTGSIQLNLYLFVFLCLEKTFREHVLGCLLINRHANASPGTKETLDVLLAYYIPSNFSRYK